MVWYSYEQLHQNQMADRGEIRPDQVIYDERYGSVRADAIPEVAPGFAARRRRLALLGVTAGVGLLALADKALQSARLRELPWEELRIAIFRRDNYTCTYCGHRGNSLSLEVDHEIPIAHGGTNDPSNLTTACWRCNREKGTMTTGEYRWHRVWRR